MTLLCTLLILAAPPLAPMEERLAETVVQWSFGEEDDRNYDQWPDGWTRRRAEGYPPYIKIALVGPDGPAADRQLQIDLDGGAAVIFSPPVDVNPLFSYVLEANVKGAELDHNVAAVAALPGIRELNIGHSIIARAMFCGLADAVRDMKSILLRAACADTC